MQYGIWGIYLCRIRGSVIVQFFFKKYIIPIEILFYQCFPSIINEIINALSFLQKEVIAVSLSIIQKMNEMLLTEMLEYRAQAAEVGASGEQQRRLLRVLMNVRPTRPLSGDFLALQDELLSAEREACGVVDVMALSSVASDARIALYAPCGGLRAHRPRAACAADSDSLVFASDRFSCPMRVPMLYYFLYHNVHKNNKR